MPQDRPTAAELLDAVREFLETDVLPEADGRRAFHARVAINVLNILQRELELGPAQQAAELQRLQTLLNKEGSIAELNAVLATEIRSGRLDTHRAAVMDCVRETVREKLLIANPKYLQS